MTTKTIAVIAKYGKTFTNFCADNQSKDIHFLHIAKVEDMYGKRIDQMIRCGEAPIDYMSICEYAEDREIPFINEELLKQML